MSDHRDELRALLASYGSPGWSPPSAQLEDFFALFRERRIARGDHHLGAGDRAATFELVVDGVVRLYYVRADGREFTKAFLRRGDVHAALESLLTGSPARYSVQAVTATRLLVADYARVEELFDRHLFWQRLARRFFEELALKKVRREAALLMDPAAARYEAFLTEFREIESLVADHMIASYLGVTPETLSRIKRARLFGTNRS